MHTALTISPLGSLLAAAAAAAVVPVGRRVTVREGDHRGLFAQQRVDAPGGGRGHVVAEQVRHVQERAGLDKEDVRSRLAFAPKVEARLKAFELRELQAKPGWLTYTRQIFWLPLMLWVVYYRCLSELRQPIRRLALHSNWSSNDLDRRQHLAKKLVRRYLTAVVRVAQYTAYERFFSFWHLAHIPFVYLLVMSAIVHVVAVHAY